MRWRDLLAALFALGLAGVAWGTEFPYVAYVTSADVYVRSGPGRDYYPTDKLQKGDQVEVYRHDPGGWYAIRPPRGSFTWISKRHLAIDGPSLATVNDSRAVARVGSSFSDARDVIQVRLDKGEKVELIEVAEDSLWCKIAPPAGEFRWVFSKFVDRDLPADVAEDERASGVRLVSDESSIQPTSDTCATAPPRREPAAIAGDGTARSSALGHELNLIDLELSTIVAQDIANWSFDELEHRAEAALRQSQTTIDRGRARVLLSKLARFSDIKRRYDAIRASGVADQRSKGATAAPAAGNVTLSAKDAARYDGVGRLSPVISEKAGGPQFALVDVNNAVVAFVTPSPGVNLRPYVDRYVGVNGQRGYLTDLQRQHINVQSVTVLDVQRR
jgi:SH3-like domain-containing protein